MVGLLPTATPHATTATASLRTPILGRDATPRSAAKEE
jgi:hypothetical protein